MILSHKILFYINTFSSGIIAPVLILVLCDHGATLTNISLYIGLYALTVIIFEFPSGILSDLVGRKKTFLSSNICVFLSYLFIYFSDNSVLLIFACIFLGIGRALGSGSIEAIEIEQSIEKNGMASISKINNTLAKLESMGLAFGSLFGGYLAYLDKTYTIILVILMIFHIVIFLIALLIINESYEFDRNTKLKILVSENLNSFKSTIKKSSILKIILVMGVVLGMILTTIETYWQPTLINLLPQNLIWILGFSSFSAYLAIAIGSIFGEKLLNSKFLSKISQKKLYYFFRILLAFAVMTISICNSWYLFIIIYSMLYLLLGIGNLFENNLLHSSINNHHRATMLSISSLFMKSGGVISSILGTIIMSEQNMSLEWIVIPIISIIIIIGVISIAKSYKFHA